MKKEKNRTVGTSVSREKKGILFTVVLVIAAILLNLGAALIPGRYRTADASASDYYTLADSTKTFLSILDEDVTVYLINAGGNDQRFEYFLRRFCQYSKHLSLRYVDLEDSAALLEKVGATTDQLTSVGYCVMLESEKRSEIIDYNSLFYYETANSTLTQLGMSQMSVSDYYSWLNTFYSYASQDESYVTYLDALLNETDMYFQGQGVICAMMEYVVADVLPLHYVVTGHGEMDFSSSLLAGMLSTYGETYGVLDVTATASIPEDAASLLIMSPAEDYSAAEIDMLKAYLNRGGQVTVVTGESHLTMPNLMSLMAYYGMSAIPGFVGMDVEAEETEEETDGEETLETETVYSLDVQVNTQHDAFAAGASETTLAPVIKNGNAITFGSTGDASLLLTSLLTTSDKAFIGEDRTTMGQKTLAAAAETAAGAHLLWFTGAESYTVSLADLSTNSDAVYNNFCLYLAKDWATLKYESTVENPEATLYQMDYASPTDAQVTVFGVLVIGLIPLTLVGVGVVLWYKRKKV
ncbi:MAG: Gldg family protein [Clostridia bacterium]|nr:Gldg family protein [Clostridia bacterium]